MFQPNQQKESAPVLIQPQLEIGKENDEQEKEANQVADNVMKIPDPEEGKKKMSDGSGKLRMMTDLPGSIRKMSDGNGGALIAPPKVEQGINSSRGNGQSLPAATQQEMSSKLGADLSNVNIHTGSNAIEMNKEIGAKAFTSGDDIYFNSGQYNPSSDTGKHLLAHELTHTVQQDGGVKRKIQKTGDPQSFIPNEELAGTRGSLDYLPEKADLVNQLNRSVTSVEARKTFIIDFFNTFYPYYLKLLATGNWEKTKDIAAKAVDEVFTANQQTAPMMDRGQPRSSHWTDFGKRMSMSTASLEAIDLIDQRPLEDADRVQYPVLNTVVKGNQSAYDVVLDNAAQTADSTADFIMQLRAVSNIISRVYTTLTVSEKTGMDFGRVTALYGQEGNFDIPSSADSLSKNIPTAETKGVTSLGVGTHKMDFKGMVFTVPTDNIYMTLRPSSNDRKLFALAQYFNQIGGLDVVNSKLKDGVDSLAAWSMNTRTKLNERHGLPASLQSDTLTAMKIMWTSLINNIQEDVISFKTTTPDPDPTAPKDKVYRFAPVDPVFMVTTILTEAALFQKTYDYFPSGMMGTAGDALELNPGVSYIMFNSARNNNYNWGKTLFLSSIKSAKELSLSKIGEITNKNKSRKAADVTFTELKTANPAMSDEMIYYLLELRTFPAGIIPDNPKPTQFKLSVQPWILEEASTGAPYTRWNMAQYYIEHAGTDIWTSWAQTRRNSSNLRTLMEFYQNAFH